MYKKFLFLTSLVLLLSLAYNSYGDAVAPKPNPLTWADVPATTGPTTITMRATTAIDVNDPPVQYRFTCTTNGSFTSAWQSSPTYEATGLTPSTPYSFKVYARDNVGNVDPCSIVLSATTDAATTPPVLRLDLNNTANNDDANTQTGFLKFSDACSGSDINGVTIDLSGNIASALRGDPCGAWTPYSGDATNDPCYYAPRAGERLYRDFIYGTPPSGVTITLWDLGVNRDCNITIWAYDSHSTGDVNRVAKWYANGTHIFDTNFIGGSAGYPLYDNQPNGAKDLYKYAFKGRASTDNFGRLVLTSSIGPSSPAGEPFAFVDALKVEPNSSSTFTPTPYAHRPLPADGGTQCVPVNAALQWNNGAGVASQDLYFGTNYNDVNTADENSQGPGVLIYAPGLTTPSYDPFGAAGFLELDKTYYWRVDEKPGIYKGETWSFTTCPNSVVDNFDEYNSQLVAVLRAVWKDYITQSAPKTSAYVWNKATPNHGGGSSWSMEFDFDNYSYAPYYSEARAAVATARPNGLGIDPDWLDMGAKSLALFFYGQAGNDPLQPMYVKLTDSGNVSATVNYAGDMNDITDPEWHEWDIDLTAFTGVDLTNVKTFTIGFGNGTPTATDGVVYFDDIQLYTTRCALVQRDADFAKLDFAPAGAPSGDCVIDYQELVMMASVWLNRDSFVDTNRPGDSNLVIWYPMLNESPDGNKIYNHRDTNNPDVCDTSEGGKWTGTFWNSANTTSVPVGYYGTTFAPGAPGIGGPNSVYLNGSQGSRVECGQNWHYLSLGIGPTPPEVNAMTLSVWVKWLGPRTWDGYLMAKSQGILGKRGGWDDVSMLWMLECDTGGGTGSFGLRHYVTDSGDIPDVYTANNLLTSYIGQWVHIAAAFPYPAANPVADTNSHARLYLNGGLVRDLPWRFSHGYDPNIFLSVGDTQDQNAWPDCPESFYGYIDEVRIYNRALDPNEIAYLASKDPNSGVLWIPIPSAADVYTSEPHGQGVVNFKDFALMVNRWLTEEMYPR